VNPALRRTGVVALVLLGALLLQVTYVQFFGHAEYDRFNDSRTLYSEYEVPRGSILAGDVVLAESLESDEDSPYDYYRHYPEALPFANVTGFKSPFRGASGIERMENAILNGSDPLFFVDELRGVFTGEQAQGGNVVLTVDPDLQRRAYELLANAGVKGGVVVVDPRSGQILAQASYPSWDPNPVSSDSYNDSTEVWGELNENPDNPMLDRTVRDFAAPGSTFKTVVAAAFIDGGHGDADTIVPAGNSYTAPNTSHEIRNSSNQCPQEQMTLREAFAKSCNTTFAKLCVETLSADDINTMAGKLGFGEAFRTTEESVVSRTGDIADPAFRAQACIGQQDVRETVMQNAVIAAAVANDGQIMAPQIVDRVTDFEDETTLKTYSEKRGDRAFSASTAAELRDIMEAVVTSGTGTNARVGGYTVGGKTGTAEHTDESGNALPDHGWFHGWALDDSGDPVVAVAVWLHSYGQGGSPKAAEISGQLMRQVLEGD
jgi:penicillin-binding protein A